MRDKQKKKWQLYIKINRQDDRKDVFNIAKHQPEDIKGNSICSKDV